MPCEMDDLTGINERLITLVEMGKAEEIIRSPGLLKVPQDIRYLDYKLLRLAVKCNDICIADICLVRGFRVNPDASVHEPVDTPLHFAVKHRNLDMLILLLRNGASVEHKNEDGLTPLQTTLMSGIGTAIEWIMHELDTYHYFKYLVKRKHLSLMHMVCLRGSWEDLECIYSRGEENLMEPVPLSSPIWPGCTNLHLAVVARSIKLMEFLVSKGIDTTSRDAMNLTAMDYAVKLGSESFVALLLRFYLDKDVGLTETNSGGMTLLHVACTLGNEWNELTHDLIKRGASVHATTSLEFTEAPGYTPLHFACKHGSLYNVRVLMESGADPTIKNGNGETPMHLVRNQPEIIRACFRKYKHFTIDTRDKFGTSHFHLACLYGHYQLVDQFIYRDPWTNCNARVTMSPSISAYHGSSPLHLAVRLSENEVSAVNQTMVLARLLECTGIKVNAFDKHGQTALHILMESGYRPLTAEVLIYDPNVNVNIPNLQGQTALHIAAQREDLSDQVNMLIYSRANLLATDLKGQTPMHVAHENILPLLLHAFMRENDFVTSRNVRDMKGRSIFDIACENYKISYARSIVNRFLEDSILDQTALTSLQRIRLLGETALHAAAEGRYSMTVRTLLRLGLANVHDVDVRRATALHVIAADNSGPALENQRMEIAQILINEGVNIEATTLECKSTALHWAAKSNSIGLIQLLIEHKANLSPRDKSENTPLHVAAYNCSVEAVQLLIRAGVDPNERTDTGCTALHKASGKYERTQIHRRSEIPLLSNPKNTVKRYSKLIEALLYAPKSHVNVNVKNNEGLTPLCTAFTTNNATCTKAFLEHGADPEKTWHRMIALLTDRERVNGPMLLIAQQMLRLCVAKLLKDRELYNVLLDFGIPRREQVTLREVCNEELTRMAEVYVDPHTTLKDLLYKKAFAFKPHIYNYQLQKMLVINLSDEERKKELPLLLEKYPNYAPLLRRSFRYALQQEQLMQEATRALGIISDCVMPEEIVTRVIPENCIETILNMVEMEDLSNLVEAVFYKKM